MLERYEPNFDENEFIRSFMEARGLRTKKEAMAALRKESLRRKDQLEHV